MGSRVGVLICDCQGQISDRLDTAKLADAAADLEGVVHVIRCRMLCAEIELGQALRRVKDAGCGRVLVAGCSPRSSLRFPEERLASLLGALGMDPALFEIANVREQCAWQHPDKEEATAKATDLVRMAHARLVRDESAPGAVDIPRRALVVGGGPAGLQAAKDLAAAGIVSVVAEREPYVGGTLCRLERIFQSESWPSVCDAFCVGPVQAKGAVLDEKVALRTRTAVTAAEHVDGAFRVTLESEPEFVNPKLCISCDLCAQACPEEVPRAFDAAFSLRKAIDKEFERALPDHYTILPGACTFCGECVKVCPTNAIDLEAKPRIATEDFGAVFLATGAEPIDLSGYDHLLRSHPNVVTSLEFERLMAKGVVRPSDGEEPERIVFVQCAGSRADVERGTEGVPYCSKTCCSITAKQVDRLMVAHPMIEPMVVYYRDLRTYERALETLYQRLRASGVEFVNGEVEKIEASNGSLKVTIDPIRIDPEPEAGDDCDEAADWKIDLDADLVVLAAAQTPARGTKSLHEMFGVQVDRHGYPIENQPRLFRPTESLVNRVFAIGASAGPKVIQQASEQGSAAAMRALPELLKGTTEPPRYASRVNPERCTGCRTCLSVCPHGAIRMTAEGAVIDPAFCQACGFCQAACPVHAAELTSYSDAQMLAQATVAFESLPQGVPRILALLCYWCSYSAADFAGIERVDAPSNYRVIRMRCSSSVNTALLLQMFRKGVDGIVVAGCPERSCHHLWGNFVADKRIELARAVMGQLGLSAKRLRFEYIGAPMQAKLMEVIRSMDASLRELGPNPVARREEVVS